MHYLPDPLFLDDGDDNETLTVGSRISRGRSSSNSNKRRSGKRRGSRDNKRPNHHNNHSNSYTDDSPSSSAHHKAKKTLGKLIKRSFAKHKPAPTSSSTNNNMTQEYDAAAAARMPTAASSEQDALLTGVNIHCNPYDVIHSSGSASVTLDSQSYKSGVSGHSSHRPPSSTMSVGSHNHRLYQSQHHQQQQPQAIYHISPPQSPLPLHHQNSQQQQQQTLYNLPHASMLQHNTDDNDSYYRNPPQKSSQERASRIQKAQDDIRAQMSFSIWHCILAIVLYVAVTIVIFSYFLEDWTFLDSSYFAVVTFTTIGYGDVVPDTMDARLFTCVWALSGVSCLGIALGVLGSNLIAVHEQEMEQAQEERQSRVIGLFDSYETTTSNNNNNINITRTSPVFSTIEEGKRRVMYDFIEDSDDEQNNRRNRNARGTMGGGWCDSCTWSLVARLLRGMILLVFFAGLLYLISQSEEWDVITTVYYAIITASTVGYGDFSPKTENGRLLSIVFIPIAVGVMSKFLETVANAIIDSRRRRYQDYLNNKPLTVDDIQVFDVDGDGEVTRAEFLEFMLVAMNQVDKSLLDNLKEHFNRLDKDKSGTLDKRDLVHVIEGSFRLANNGNNYKDYHSNSSTSPTSAISAAMTEQGRRPTLITHNHGPAGTVSLKKAPSAPYQTRIY